MDGGFFPLRKTGMEGDYSRIGNGTGIFRQLRMEGKTRRRRDEGGFSLRQTSVEGDYRRRDERERG